MRITEWIVLGLVTVGLAVFLAQAVMKPIASQVAAMTDAIQFTPQ